MPKRSKYPRLRVYVKRGKAGQVWTSYAYDMRGTGKPDIALGSDYAAALLRWHELHEQAPKEAGTIEEALKAWEAEVLPHHKPETRRDYTKSLRMLRPVFGPAMWSAVKMPTLKDYLKKRSGKTRANREIALLSVVWNWARGEGYTALPWPAAGMERSRWKNKETPRDVEVTDEAFDAIYKYADTTLRDALDIATATGLRVRDVLGLRISDVRDGFLSVQAGKTTKRIAFDVAASAVLPDILERRRQSKSAHVFLLDAGRVVTERMLHDRFVKARALAAKEVPECAGLILRDMRKRAAQLSPTLEAASTLLQHSSTAVTRRHYRGSEKVRPVR